ncbi:hypothetical protein GQ600_16030 [Phytophthora cactorum]|nr:hypothetical protein GQ600_18209 [Phytophthora cactorum]KAF1783112.1 hypothetical protein GQ600_16030 [Phytophthora cactorum]
MTKLVRLFHATPIKPTMFGWTKLALSWISCANSSTSSARWVLLCNNRFTATVGFGNLQATLLHLLPLTQCVRRLYCRMEFACRAEIHYR